MNLALNALRSVGYRLRSGGAVTFLIVFSSWKFNLGLMGQAMVTWLGAAALIVFIIGLLLSWLPDHRQTSP